MKQYIDKADVIAEINKRIIDAPVNNIGHQRVWAYNDVKDIIQNLEVKKVDLEQEATEFVQAKEFAESNESPVLLIAKHFFELGLKAQKGDKL